MDGDVEVEPIMESPPEQRIVVDEVVEAITLPKFNEESIRALDKASSVELDEEILTQLKDYISTMALMYRQVRDHTSSIFLVRAASEMCCCFASLTLFSIFCVTESFPQL